MKFVIITDNNALYQVNELLLIFKSVIMLNVIFFHSTLNTNTTYDRIKLENLQRYSSYTCMDDGCTTTRK